MTMKGSWMVSCFFLLLSGYLHAADKPKGEAMLDVIHARKSVRNFTGAPATKSALEKVLRAGMAAPSARNHQPWSFVAVTDRKKLDSLAAGLPSAKMLHKAGAAIIVCTEPEKAAGQSRELAIIDATLAGQNILLAVEALGLGAVWTAVYPDVNLMEHVRSELGIPKGTIPLNVIPVGVPTGEDKPKDKYKVEKVHWEKW
jgi:nitroreductase